MKEEKRQRATKVLVVDDDLSMVQLLHLDLKKRGFEVFEALSGEEGLEIARGELPDVIILDVDMYPGISGAEVCRRLRLDSDTENIPIIFLTGKVNIDAMSRVFEGEAQDYIRKPFLPSVLVGKIEEFLERGI